MSNAVLFKPNERGGPRVPHPVPDDKEFTIGRSHTASLDVPKPEVSRLHCIIGFKDDHWTICDKSLYGTSLNGNLLHKGEITRLYDGDKIGLSILRNSYVFCYNGENCPQNCKDFLTEEIITDSNDDKCKELQKSIKKSKSGMEELKVLQTALNEKFNLQMRGLQERIQEQLKSQTPEQVKLLKEEMDREKAEIQEKYSKEVEDLGKRLEESKSEQDNLRQQIDLLFEERGRDSNNLKELELDLNLLKQEKESLGRSNADLEKRVSEMSETIEAEKENVKKQCLDNIGEIMESELQCCVCNELFVKATTINCSHTFCEKCINSWLSNNQVCPMCRAVVTSKTRSLVIDTYIDKMVETLSDELKDRRKTLLQEREEEAKNTPPPRPLGHPPHGVPNVITVRTVNGQVQVIPHPLRLPDNVRIVQPIGIRPVAPPQGTPVIVRTQQVVQPGSVQPGSQHGRNVRPRLPNAPGPAVIDLTGLNPQTARLAHSNHRRRHGRH